MANDEYYTPLKYIKLVYKVLEAIDLDPASCSIAQQTVKATSYFTKEQNGLRQDWKANNIFLNFPYSDSKSWIIKTLQEYNNYHFNNAIILANAITDTAGFHLLLRKEKIELPLLQNDKQLLRTKLIAVCFVESRINFIDELGTEQKNPFYPSMFVCISEHERIINKFIEVFEEIGTVLILPKM